MKLDWMLGAIKRIRNDKFITRNLAIIFVLIYSLFFPNNLFKYIFVGMWVILMILNLREEFVKRNYK